MDLELATGMKIPLKAHDLNGMVNLKLLRESHVWKREQERARREIAFQRRAGSRDRSAERLTSATVSLDVDTTTRPNGKDLPVSSAIAPIKPRPRTRARSAHSRRYINLTDDQLKIQRTPQGIACK